MSQISLVFECLLEEEERRLKENPVDSVQWAETVLTVNNILKVNNNIIKLNDTILKVCNETNIKVNNDGNVNSYINVNNNGNINNNGIVNNNNVKVNDNIIKDNNNHTIRVNNDIIKGNNYKFTKGNR